MGIPAGWVGRVITITPCGLPDALLCAAASRAGALGVLDLGPGDRPALRQLDQAIKAAGDGPLAVRVSAGCRATIDEMAGALGTGHLAAVLLGPETPWSIAEVAVRWPVLAEVTSVAAARAAQQAGVHGLIARGAESGGLVSDLGSFVLVQQLLGEEQISLPVWACGGIGPATATAAVAGGAAGVVLDTQLALLMEARLPEPVQVALEFDDGTGTELVEGRRVLAAAHPEVAGLPVGQDAFLATRFAARYGSVARAIKAVDHAVRAARVAEVAVAPGATFARAFGTALPVAQGPMTRVSDQAGFARAVADAGALPFLALALSSAEQTRTLLAEATEELAESPWGVGILGFAPDEVRAAQLAAVQEFRPAAALIAGGRPDQAATLEDAGIPTFLHVPSPTLLRQFLRAGARRFVFEGAECGGHVGPRSSFCLWQSVLDELLDFLDAGGSAEELHLLFAGGIHDARSAAMVSALAVPLTARGAAVGVLMGTAYLFTEEAVAYGAVRPVFQRAALTAESTVLLETAPGHVTRCLPSPFTDEFSVLRRELLTDGTGDRATWQRLEELNVGRLRIASKGLRRDGSELVPVDEATQQTQGLFMAGQAAVLRSATTDLATLHREVTEGAVEFLGASSATRPDPAEGADRVDTPAPLDVAVVGISAMFPGAPDLPTFWSNILGNFDTIGEVPRERWDPDVYYTEDTAPSTGDRTYSKWGGFLPEIPFDALSYGIPPAALGSIEPVQLLALEAAQRALRDAGYADRKFDRERASVIFGTESGSDLAGALTLRLMLRTYLAELPTDLDARLPRLTEDSFTGKLANVIAGRIANRLDLGGVNYTVDAACGSSLAAVDAACKELVAGTSDLVLCGGADLHNSIEDFLLFSSVGALSPTGRCRPFDADGDGIALGEGVACLVLKRLADAERDGDRVYSVIRGIGAGSDGRALGLTAPRAEGQRRAMDRAYRNARVSPAQIGLVEAHGTGTVVGDRTELSTLTSLFTESDAPIGGCVLGSVKSQIGHTKCTAGMAGLIKAALAIHNGVLPPTRINRPNPAWTAAASPFVFRTEPAPWIESAEQRLAGVSAFGFGGTNFHVVLGGHGSAECSRHASAAWPAELFLVRGGDEAAAAGQMRRLRTLLSTNDEHGRPWALRDMAKTVSAWSARETTPVRLAFVAGDLDELTRLVDGVVAGTPPAVVRRAVDPVDGKLAVLFPGQGSQRPGMLAELFVAFPGLRRISLLGGPAAAAMFPPAAFDADQTRAHRDRLRATQVAQPALGMAGLAMQELLTQCGVKADMFAGHSYGELVALTAAGALDPSTLLELSVARATAILAAAGDDPGGMAAVSASPADIDRALDQVPAASEVVLANHNAPGQTVLAGPSPALDAAVEAMRAAGLSVTPLPVACAFHSPVVAEAGITFGAALAAASIRQPERLVWTNRTAAPYPSDVDAVRSELAEQVGSPVRFVDQIEAMYAAGARVFVEAGPGSVLGGLVGRILADRTHTVVSPGEAGLRGFLDGLAQLAAAGVDLRTGWLHSGRPGRDLTFAEPPSRPRWTVDGQTVRTNDGAVVTGGQAPHRRITLSHNPRTDLVPHSPGSADRDALVAEFLRTSRELVTAQRDVLLGYFGADGTTVRPTAVPEVRPAAPEPVVAPVVEPAAATEPDAAPDPLSTVITLIARKTGYPPEMIDPELDLEADLSVDSIKRTEIAGELADALPHGPALLEELTRCRTAGAMARTLGGSAVELVASPASTPTASATSAPAPGAVNGGDQSATAPVPVRRSPEELIRGERPLRYVMELAEAPGDPDLSGLAGATIVIAGGERRLTTALADRLSTHGALPVLAEDTFRWDESTGAIGLVSLHALTTGADPILPELYPFLRSTLPRLRWCLAVAGTGPQSWGLRGFFRSVQREHPTQRVRLIEDDLGGGLAADPDRLAEAVVTELASAGESVVSLGEKRRVPRLVSAPLGGLAVTGSGPVGHGAADLAAAGLDHDSVVLLIGGARGITARVTVGLAAATRCRLELAGRTQIDRVPTTRPSPGTPAEPAELAAATDLLDLRAALARLDHHDPVEIDRLAQEILARREVAATLAEVRRHGSLAIYHMMDATEPDAMRRLVKQVHAERGRLDCVMFAAGVIDDRMIAAKDTESFARVYRTKVDGARALLNAVDDLPEQPRAVVLFGSIAAVLGNQGQADYAAANDALDALGAAWADRTGGRALTVHWGPWAPAVDHPGMVTEELARAYHARGISLLDPDAAVTELFRELAWGDRTAVLYTASVW